MPPSPPAGRPPNHESHESHSHESMTLDIEEVGDTDGLDVPPLDRGRIEAAVREILVAIGEDPDRDGLVETPRRVARMYEEIFSGLREDPGEHLKVVFEANHDEMVMVKD